MRALLVVIVGLLSSVGLEAECRTPIGIPCYTVEHRTRQIALFHRGLTDLSNISLRSIHAVGADGSTYHEEGPDDATGAPAVPQTVWIYNASSDRIFVASPQERTYYLRTPMMWHDRPLRLSKDSDKTCHAGILHIGTDFQLLGFEKVLGMQAARWHREMGNGGYEDIWLAPELNCAGLRHIQVLKNALHLPTFITKSQASRIDTARPDPTLFGLPIDYRQVSVPGRIQARGARLSPSPSR